MNAALIDLTPNATRALSANLNEATVFDYLAVLGLALVVVHEGLVRKFEQRLARLQRRASKLTLTPPSSIALGRQDIERKEVTEAGFVAKWIERYHWYAVDNPVVQVPGWQVVGVLEGSREGKNLVKVAPGYEEKLGAEYMLKLREGNWCDHCKTKRYRASTVVLWNDETQTAIRVGKTCLKAYMGEDAAKALFYVKCSQAWDDEDLRGCGAGAPRVDVNELLSGVIGSIRLHGWLSRGAARDGAGEATADTVWQAYFTAISGCEGSKAAAELFETTAEEDVEIKAVLEWVASIPEDTSNNYLHNLRTCLVGSDGINGKELGIAASAVVAYRRDQERKRQAEMAAQASAGHFGAPGDKIGRKLSAKDKRAGKATHPTLQVQILKCRCFEGNFGPKTTITMRDEAGHTFIWWMSGYARLEVGSKHTLVATIKDHDEFMGVAQTVVQRAVLTPC